MRLYGFLAYVLSIQKHLTYGGVEEPFNQMHRTRFTCPRTTHESDILALPDMERYIVQGRYVWATGVVQTDSPEFEVSSDTKGTITCRSTG